MSIEVDPREIGSDVLDHLRAEGFNRLSMGGAGFQAGRQQLVNREQDEAFISPLIERASAGLPLDQYRSDLRPAEQTPESFAFTLQRVAELNPDRLSVFNYAHMPNLFAAQRKIKDADLPGRSRSWISSSRASRS